MSARPQGMFVDSLQPPIRGLIVDMDGVLWKDSVPIGDLPTVFHAVESRGLKIVLATNNATMTVAENLTKLSGFGVKLEPWQIVTSAEAVARALSLRFPDRGAVFVVGEDGVRSALTAQGFRVVGDLIDDPTVVAVVAGLDRGLTFQKLRQATSYIRSGAAFYGTNPDTTFPTPGGLIPGAGAILSALAAASETAPIVVGKPAPYLFELALERMQLLKDQVLVVGDRLETDVDGGEAWGVRTALVLSGVSKREQLLGRQRQPDLVAADLTELVCPQ